MLQKIKQKILQIQQAAGIEVIFTGSEEYTVIAGIASLYKGKINQTVLPVRHFTNLPLHIKKDIPVFLVLTGKGILTRKGTSAENTPTPETILPGANPGDFYIEKITDNSETTLSLIRKEQADYIISKIAESGYKVLGFSIGAAGIQTFTQYVNEQEAKPALAGALRLLSDNLEETPSPDNAFITAERKEYRYARLFKAACLGMLSSVLLLLLINFFVYNHYFQKNKELNAYKALSEGEIKKINTLKKDISDKEFFLQNTDWSRQTKNSLLADRIASMVPGNILLTTLNIHPNETSGFAGTDNLHFKSDTIQVSGACENATEVTQFMNNLKNISYIKEVFIKSYQYRKEKEAGIFIMEIITHP